jgi:CDP-6-deoxy-D-xylo-4-hexulose-3-dehydrase
MGDRSDLNLTGLLKLLPAGAAMKDFELAVEPLEPGRDYLPPSGKVIGKTEISNLLEAVFDVHYTEGRWVDLFEKKLSKHLGMRFGSMTNSGSSANLLAMLAVKEFMSIPDGAKVITAACGFPTTLAPIIQAGLQPFFVDVELGTYVPTTERLQAAVDSRVKAIFIAHTLGNPWPVCEIADFCFEKGIAIIEDNCDALGSLMGNVLTGTVGLVSTCSFYPAHHITAGEGGMVFTNRPKLKKIVESYRDWGRDCWCEPGEQNTCGKRFTWNIEGLSAGYDHKYIYSRMGYNLKATDFQGAIGAAQVDRLSAFIYTRRANFRALNYYLRINGLDQYFIMPGASGANQPAWFGFPLTLKEPFDAGLVPVICRLLEEKFKIGTRRLFGGNLIRQPAFKQFRGYQFDDLKNSDFIMERAFWLGLWPRLDRRCMIYIAESLIEIMRGLEREGAL